MLNIILEILLKRPCLSVFKKTQFFKKTGWEAYLRPIKIVLGCKPKGRYEPQSQLLVHIHVLTERERERETLVGLHIGDVIAFFIFYL